MKYEYAYKTSDGARHVEEMDAPSREAVFAALRARGIKAIKVVAKEGGKANGEVRVIGVRKRVVTALVAAAALAAIALTVFVQRETAPEGGGAGPAAVLRVARPLPRQMIPGDRERLMAAPTNLFAHALERALSKFAEPGRVLHGDPFAAEADLTATLTNETALLAVLDAPLYVSESAFTEHVDLARITAGLKREMGDYVRGGGSARDYVRELLRRQQLEYDTRDKAARRLQELLAGKGADTAAAYDFWLKANARLQAMGIYPLPLPNALRDSPDLIVF